MKDWIPAFQLLGMGFYIAACILGGTLAGWWLGDKRTVFIIIGLVIGLILAILGVYRMVKPLMDKYKKSNNDKDNG